MGDSSDILGVYRNGFVELVDPVDWPEGARVRVSLSRGAVGAVPAGISKVIVAGYGLPGRCVAEFCDQAEIDCVVIERNSETVRSQSSLGRAIVEGCGSNEAVLREAGIMSADVLAVTIPNESVALRAVEMARRLNPDLYIICRTQYASRGMEAIRLGADDAIKSEQVVALQFFAKLRDHIECVVGVRG